MVFDTSRTDLSPSDSKNNLKCVDLFHGWTKFCLDSQYFPNILSTYFLTGKKKTQKRLTKPGYGWHANRKFVL